MKTKYFIPLLAAMLLAACTQKNNPTPEPEPTPSPAPHWQAEVGTLTAAPHWVVSDTDLYPSSMTVTAGGPLKQAADADTVAALLCLNDEVLGVGGVQFMENYFALYVHGIIEDPYYNAFRLCYYSSAEKQYYVSCPEDEDLRFVNDAIIGSIAHPELLRWVPCGTHTRGLLLTAGLKEGNWNEGDELALFVGESCRYAVSPYQADAPSQRREMVLPFDTDEEEAELRYYNAATEKIQVESLWLDPTTMVGIDITIE